MKAVKSIVWRVFCGFTLWSASTACDQEDVIQAQIDPQLPKGELRVKSKVTEAWIEGKFTNEITEVSLECSVILMGELNGEPFNQTYTVVLRAKGTPNGSYYLACDDPLIIQFPSDAHNFVASYQGTGGMEPLYVSQPSFLPVDRGISIMPEPEQRFVLIAMPPTSSNRSLGGEQSYDLSIKFDLSNSREISVKAILAGTVQCDNETFFPPIVPCGITSFASVAPITIPLTSSLTTVLPSFDNVSTTCDSTIECGCLASADCNDGDACTTDACNGGICSNSPKSSWDQLNECCDSATGVETTLNCTDQCELASCTQSGNHGSAQCTPRTGEACDDENPCTYNDTCADGLDSCAGIDAHTMECITSVDCEVATGLAFPCIDGLCWCDPTPIVACCIPGDACQMLTPVECTAQGGTLSSFCSGGMQVHVHARGNCWNPLNRQMSLGVPMSLGAGWWFLSVADDADPNDGYNYDAYSPWGCDTCNPQGGGAWAWAVDVMGADGQMLLTGWRPNATPYFPAQQAALDGNLGGWTALHFDAPTTVYFGISDSPCGDNRGGLTLNVCQAPACEGDADQDGFDGGCGDLCPLDPNKVDPGNCGCGVPESAECGAIPAASKWGLVVLTLLLLTGSKIAFSRKQWTSA